MKKNLILALSASLIVGTVLWQKGSDLVTHLTDRQRMTIPPVAPIVYVSGTDRHADAVTLINAAERLYNQEQDLSRDPNTNNGIYKPAYDAQTIELSQVKALAGDKGKALQMLDQLSKRLRKDAHVKARQANSPGVSLIYTLANAQAKVGNWEGTQKTLLAINNSAEPSRDGRWQSNSSL